MITIAFDEIQFLDEIDSSNKLLKLFLEKFIRYLMEQYSNEKLYILISCLENPDNKEWSNLINQSKNFQTIVKNKEIILGNLLKEERDEIITQVADKIGFEEKDRKTYFKKVKGSLFYYLPRELLSCIARVIDSMDYIGYTDFDIRAIYEEDARNYIKDNLIQRKFIHIEPKMKTVGGYDVDIYATTETRRAGYINKAFGEVSMTQKTSMKGKIEKFSNWLLRMKDREYNPDRGDYALFICPPNSVTEGAKEILEGNNIELFEFVSPNVELLQSQFRKEKELECIDGKDFVLEKKKIPKINLDKSPSLNIIKESKYKLKDVPDIGDAKEKLLNKGDIFTIKDLLNCNAKVIAQNVKGIGITSVNKWKQNARQILEK